jgi:hypothetical protein
MSSSSSPITTENHADAVREWFRRLSDACASVDYAAGRRIFAPGVASFGTKAGGVIRHEG